MTDRTDATILVVEDEPALADLYAAWLAERYDVRTANGVTAARDNLDGDVDVALVDRRLPDGSGDELLATIRRRHPDCLVAMVTALDPDADVLASGCDDYVVKPVTRATLLDVVACLLDRRAFDRRVTELFALVARRAALRRTRTRTELERCPAFRRLERSIRTIRERLGDDDASALCERIEELRRAD
ncbi:MAG: response regulator transcription factor [Haloferacaceae archaeon]